MKNLESEAFREMRVAVLWVVLPALIAFLAGATDARIYKWVDDNGVTRYSDAPPPGMAETAPPRAEPTPDARVPQTPPGQTDPEVLPVNVNFELSGEVRNDNGELLDGVTMTIVENHPRAGELGFKQTRRKQIVNGRFTIDCSGCPIHRLRFRAPGYLSETYDITATPAEKARIVGQFAAAAYGAESPVAADPITIRRRGLVIVLKAETSVVRLRPVSAQLFTGADSPREVLYGTGTALREHGYTLALKHRAEADSNGVAHAMITLSTGAMPFSYFASAGKQNALHLKDTALYLEISDIDGGFVPASPPRGAFRKRLDALTEAPAAGYQKRLPIKPTESDGAFFYCKIGAFYGKGHVVAPTYVPIGGEPMLRTHVEIYLNPNGRRNLKSRM